MTRVFFAIPLSAKRNDEQWQRLNELLTLTLNSILNQRDVRYTAFVCGHDRPPVLDLPAYASIQFLPVTFEQPANDKERRRDKRRKRWEIARRVHELGGGYFMYLDGDDAVHRDLVAYILSDDNRVGYLIDRGYALDYKNRTIAPIPGAFKRGFNTVCGSSGCVFMMPEDLPWGEFNRGDDTILYRRIRNHKVFDSEPMREGKALSSVPFPAAIYNLNNSINLSDVLVRSAERQASLVEGIRKHEVDDYTSIAEDFSLEQFFQDKI